MCVGGGGRGGRENRLCTQRTYLLVAHRNFLHTASCTKSPLFDHKAPPQIMDRFSTKFSSKANILTLKVSKIFRSKVDLTISVPAGWEIWFFRHIIYNQDKSKI